MFQRILVEDWATYVRSSPRLIAGVFIAAPSRPAHRQGERNRFAFMPLEETLTNRNPHEPGTKRGTSPIDKGESPS